MILKKLNELFFNNNDIYILETYDDTIIINDNYQGLLLLNDSLHIKKQLPIPQNICIYSLYIEQNGKAIIAYSPDNEIMILIDTNTSHHCPIALPSALNNEVLSHNYYWNNNILIFTTFNNDFYQLNYTSHQLQPITDEAVQKICSFDFTNNKQNIINNANNNWHDVEHNNNYFLFIAEDSIEAIHNDQKNSLKPQCDYIFLKAKFIQNNRIVILSSKPSNSQESLLEIYELCDKIPKKIPF